MFVTSRSAARLSRKRLVVRHSSCTLLAMAALVRAVVERRASSCDVHSIGTFSSCVAAGVASIVRSGDGVGDGVGRRAGHGLRASPHCLPWLVAPLYYPRERPTASLTCPSAVRPGFSRWRATQWESGGPTGLGRAPSHPPLRPTRREAPAAAHQPPPPRRSRRPSVLIRRGQHRASWSERRE